MRIIGPIMLVVGVAMILVAVFFCVYMAWKGQSPVSGLGLTDPHRGSVQLRTTSSAENQPASEYSYVDSPSTRQTYAAGRQPSHQNQYPPPQGQYPPPQGQYPPPQGQYSPSQGQYPRSQGQHSRPYGQPLSAEGQYPSSRGQYLPPEGQYPPSHGGHSPSRSYPQRGYEPERHSPSRRPPSVHPPADPYSGASQPSDPYLYSGASQPSYYRDGSVEEKQLLNN